jgi:hypothetical protein
VQTSLKTKKIVSSPVNHGNARHPLFSRRNKKDGRIPKKIRLCRRNNKTLYTWNKKIIQLVIKRRDKKDKSINTKKV